MMDVLKEAEERSKSFYLLSYFFLEKPQNFFEKIKRKEFIDFFKNFKYFDDFFKEIENLKEEEILNRLRIDYTRLMKGIKEGYSPLPPYESCYRGKKLTDYEDVLNFYKETNVGIDLKNEMPDHIGIELKFISVLAYKEKKYLERKDLKEAEKFLNYQKKFLEKHILKWVLDFLKEMEEKATTNFYKGLSSITREILLDTKGRIDELIKFYKNFKKGGDL